MKGIRKFNYLSQIKSTSSSFKDSFKGSTFVETHTGSSIWGLGVMRSKNLSKIEHYSK